MCAGVCWGLFLSFLFYCFPLLHRCMVCGGVWGGHSVCAIALTACTQRDAHFTRTTG
jgi:hypothetical protein